MGALVVASLLLIVLNISYQFSSENLSVMLIFLLSIDLFHICSLLCQKISRNWLLLQLLIFRCLLCLGLIKVSLL